MPRPQAHVVLTQHKRVDYRQPLDMRMAYKVIQLVNLVEPAVGEVLTKSKVEQLINAGVKVTIKELK